MFSLPATIHGSASGRYSLHAIAQISETKHNLQLFMDSNLSVFYFIQHYYFLSMFLLYDKIVSMKKILTYSITNDENGLSVGQFLKLKGYSKHLINRLKTIPMGISVADYQVSIVYILKTEETLKIQLEELESSSHIVAVPMELNIVYEDEDLLVINKPSGLPIHPSQGHFYNTLANGMAYYFQQKGEPFIYRAINRLDKDTSGLLILARHSFSAALLSKMVAEHQIHRQYLAIARGEAPQEGTITAPIARTDDSTIERCVDFENGDYACTHFSRLHYNPSLDCSLLSLTLETGRTHQIRVHLKYIGYPLLGDFLYYPDFTSIKRQALHSHRLEFSHPLTETRLVFEAPIPEDMQFVFSQN